MKNNNDSQKAVPLEVPPDKFYGKEDSCYIRVQYVPDVDGFKFEVRNEMYQNLTEEPSKAARTISAFVRGMLEISLGNSVDVYDIGVEAQRRDITAIGFDSLTDEQRMLMTMTPKGEA